MYAYVLGGEMRKGISSMKTEGIIDTKFKSYLHGDTGNAVREVCIGASKVGVM